MYRIGGDEFVVLYHGNDVDGVCRELEKGFRNENGPDFCDISIGRTLLSHPEELEAALSDADERMYATKNAKKRMEVD